MGFYGNVSNITRSTFQFDKIYPNRAAMDPLNDGVFVGRYVLVEYDYENDGKDIISKESEGEENSSSNSTYNKNAMADEKYERTYDSTVWMKQYVNGKAEYIMIAELNTIVPTIEVNKVAPNEGPKLNEKSSNINYIFDMPQIVDFGDVDFKFENFTEDEIAKNESITAQGSFSEMRSTGEGNEKVYKRDLELKIHGLQSKIDEMNEVLNALSFNNIAGNEFGDKDTYVHQLSFKEENDERSLIVNFKKIYELISYGVEIPNEDTAGIIYVQQIDEKKESE